MERTPGVGLRARDAPDRGRLRSRFRPLRSLDRRERGRREPPPRCRDGRRGARDGVERGLARGRGKRRHGPGRERPGHRRRGRAGRSLDAGRRSLRWPRSSLLRDGDGVRGRRVLLRRNVRRAWVLSDQRQRVHRRDARRLRRRGCRSAAVLPERDVQRQAVLRRRSVHRAGPDLRGHSAARGVRQLGLRRVRRRRADLLHRRARRRGQRCELLHRVGRGVQSRNEQVHGLRWKRAALLRRGLLRWWRVLRPDGEDVRGQHRDVRRRTGQVLQRGVPGRGLRRGGRRLLRRWRRVHGGVFGVPGERVRGLRGNRGAVLPREQRGGRVVQRRRGMRDGELRRVRRERPGVLRRRGVQGGDLHRGEVPVAGRVPFLIF